MAIPPIDTTDMNLGDEGGSPWDGESFRIPLMTIEELTLACRRSLALAFQPKPQGRW